MEGGGVENFRPWPIVLRTLYEYQLSIKTADHRGLFIVDWSTLHVLVGDPYPKPHGPLAGSLLPM